MKDTSIEEIIRIVADAPKTVRNIHERVIKKVLESVEEDISRHHMEVLKVLDEDGELSITEIGGVLVISKPQMTRLIDELTTLGVIQREADSKDRRKSIISLTDKGRQTISRAMERFYQTVREILHPLSEQDLEELSISIGKVSQIMQKMN